jgi:hypothetical protein
MFKLPPFRSNGVAAEPRPPQPFSPTTLNKHSRTRGALKVGGGCPCCAVGCSAKIYVRNRKGI